MLEETVTCTECFKLLGVPSRMQLYMLLKDGSKSVSELAQLVNLTQPTISYHLIEMKTHGLLKSRKKGKGVYYSILGKCPHYAANCVLSNVQFPHEKKENYA